jgi:hypothetical protein
MARQEAVLWTWVRPLRLSTEYENRLQPGAIDRPVMSSAVGWFVFSYPGSKELAINAPTAGWSPWSLTIKWAAHAAGDPRLSDTE